MSIIGEFESLDKCSVNTGTSNFYNTQSLTLADFEKYCALTDTDSAPSKSVPLRQNNDVESCKNSDILSAQGLPEIERELKFTPTSSWFDSTEHVHNEGFESALTLSPSLFSSGKRKTAVHIETSHDDKFKEIASWTNNQVQETKTYPFKVVGDAVDQRVTNVMESGHHIPSSLMATTDNETATIAFSEMMEIPHIYSNAQPHPFRVELGNNGQQYMIVDSKYLTQNTEDTIPLQSIGGSNAYFLAEMSMKHFGECPAVATQSSDSQSASTNSSLSNQQEPRAGTPFEVFGGYTEEEDTAVDDSVLQEQKRKSLMQMRRREKNKDCSRAFRRKQKQKEHTLRASRIEKQSEHQELTKKIEQLFRILTKAALQGCDKAKRIAARGLQTWNKENTVLGGINHCNL